MNTSDLESDLSNMAGTRVFGPHTQLADGNDLDARIAPRPENFVLFTNYPNPFNPETEIRFGLPEPAEVTITISDLLGREITTLTSGKHPAGYHTLRWVGSDGNGGKVGTGIYFYRMNAIGESGRRFMKVMKMALMK